jgi:hypothetical protein
VNLVRYWEWLLENIQGADKKVLNFTAQSFYLRKNMDGVHQLEIYGKTVNGLIEVEVECQAIGDQVENIREKVEEERKKRNDVLLSLKKLQSA